MIRILYITDTLMSGGVERQLTELITRLDRTRYEPYVLCLYAQRAGRSLYFLERLQATKIPVRILDRGWTPLDKGLALLQILQEVWKLRPDIVQAMNYHSNLLTRMGRLAMPAYTNLIGTLRNASTNKQLRYERLSWRFCRMIICNSPHLVQQLTETGHVPARYVRYVPNGVDMEHFSKMPPAQEIARIRGDAQRVFVSIGRISEQKSHHLLVEALGALKTRGELPEGVKLIIVGEVEQSAIHYKNLIDDAIARYQLQEVVSLHTQTPHPEYYYHAADVMVLASLWEGLPNVALESLAVGKPLIISDAANSANIIQHGVQGWVVEVKNVPQLADALLEVILQPTETHSRMQSAALERARDFDMQNMVKNYQAIYGDLSARPKP